MLEAIRPVEPPPATAPARLAQPDHERAAQPSRAPLAPRPRAPLRDKTRPSGQGSDGPQLDTPRPDTKPAHPRRHRYAAPREDRAATPFREVAPPPGTSANVKAYTFAANRGRMTGAYGAPVQVFQVP